MQKKKYKQELLNHGPLLTRVKITTRRRGGDNYAVTCAITHTKNGSEMKRRVERERWTIVVFELCEMGRK